MSPPRRSGKPIAIVFVLAVLAVGGWFVWAMLTSKWIWQRPATVHAEPGHSKPAGKPVTPEAVAAIERAVEAKLMSPQPEQASAIINQAIVEHPTEQRFYVKRAEVLLAQRKVAEASGEYDKAEALAPKFSPALHLKAGTVASMAGRHDRAVEHFSAARAAEPQNPESALLLATAQMKLGRIDEARASLAIAVKLAPELAPAWGMLAEIALQENSPTVAVQHAGKARALEPDRVAWRVLEARALRRSNQPAKAVVLLAGLNDQQRREPGVLKELADAYAMLDQRPQAAAVYTRASDLEQGVAELAIQAALRLEIAGDLPGAAKYAERASITGDKKAQELLERLRKR